MHDLVTETENQPTVQSHNKVTQVEAHPPSTFDLNLANIASDQSDRVNEVNSIIAKK